MLHDHEGYDSHATLTMHVDTRHAASMPVADELHWHFVSPRELNQEDGSDKDSNPSETSVVCLAGTGTTGAGGERLVASQLDRTPVPSGNLTAGNKRSLNRTAEQIHPISNLRPSVRVCALLCVVRC